MLLVLQGGHQTKKMSQVRLSDVYNLYARRVRAPRKFQSTNGSRTFHAGLGQFSPRSQIQQCCHELHTNVVRLAGYICLSTISDHYTEAPKESACHDIQLGTKVCTYIYPSTCISVQHNLAYKNAITS